MADKYVKCSCCDGKATHETCISGEYVCEAGDCILELALDGYVEEQLTDEFHEEFGDEIE